MFVLDYELGGEGVPLLDDIAHCVPWGGLNLQLSGGLWENRGDWLMVDGSGDGGVGV